MKSARRVLLLIPLMLGLVVAVGLGITYLLDPSGCDFLDASDSCSGANDAYLAIFLIGVPLVALAIAISLLGLAFVTIWSRWKG